MEAVLLLFVVCVEIYKKKYLNGIISVCKIVYGFVDDL
jgi:hypothetical protein